MVRATKRTSTRDAFDFVASTVGSFRGDNPPPLDLDWAQVIELLDHHRVAPLFWDGLPVSIRESLSPAVTSSLEQRVHRNQRRSVRFATELIRVVRAFDAAGLRVMPLKGPALSVHLYGDVARRHSGADLDLLVESREVDEAENVLFDLGYLRRRPGFELTPRQRIAYERVEKDYGYVHSDGQVRIDLHWRWDQSGRLFPLPFDDAWSARTSTVVAGQSIPMLSPEMLFLYLCAHGAKHTWFRLKWLCDLPRAAAVAGEGGMQSVESLARELGLTRVVTQSITIAGRLLGASVPPWVADEYQRDLVTQKVTAAAMEEVTRRAAERTTDTRRWRANSNLLYLSRLRPESLYKLRSVTSYLLEPEDWRTIRVPDRLFPLYFALRPALWTARTVTRGRFGATEPLLMGRSGGNR